MPTWRDIINALRSDVVKNNELAQMIESNYSNQLNTPFQLDNQAEPTITWCMSSSASNLPDCVMRYASYLKDQYKRMPVLPDRLCTL